ncbi:unnamed protein product [Lymnaea stagnalis]|uniref:Protein arginine N-methyltransferase 6 n=1 Tax=Lymnaea stagnalis TaxID=6523 RepID=A0AAV2HZR3_LYMST
MSMEQIKSDCELKDGGSCSISDHAVSESSQVDPFKESFFVRGQSNGKVFRMALSNKGKRSLVRDGYMYRLDHSGKNKLSWRCSARKCPAHLKTDHSIETIVEDNEKTHTHEPDAEKIERRLLRVVCKRKAAQDSTTSSQDIIANELPRLGVNLSSKSTRYLQLAMYRERRKLYPKSLGGEEFIKRPKLAKNFAAKPSGSSSSIPQTLVSVPPINYYSQPLTSVDPNFDLLSEDSETPRYHQLLQHQPYNGDELQPHPLPHLIQLNPLPPKKEPQVNNAFPQTLHAVPFIVGTSNTSVQHLSSHDLQPKICYADIRIHEEMLNDKVRTMAYRRALQENRIRLKGSTVLDVGAGTGILSHFAVQAGAAKVFAVEASSMASFAQQIVMENGRSSSITVLHSKIETAEIPEKVDVIVSEWMGYNLLYESMLSSVIVARDRFLKPGGEMFPCSASLFLAPISDDSFQERVQSWRSFKDLYDVSMESLVSLTQDALTVRVDSKQLDVESVLANAFQLCRFDLKTMTWQEAQQVKAEFNFKCYGQNLMHGFATWFTVSFPGSVTLDTSPYALPTHWGQTVMYLKTPIAVKQDSEIKGVYYMHPSKENHRFWDIELEFQFNQGQTYSQHWQCAD